MVFIVISGNEQNRERKTDEQTAVY